MLGHLCRATRDREEDQCPVLRTLRPDLRCADHRLIVIDMARLLARLAGVVVFIALPLFGGVAAHAASYPVSTLTFPSGPISLPSHPIGLSGVPLRFPSDALNFPSNLMQSETSTTIEVTLPADVLFDFDKAEIRPDAAKTLHEVGQLVSAKAHGPVAVQGYTDALGNDGYNQRLSERRAAAVRTWLVSH